MSSTSEVFSTLATSRGLFTEKQMKKRLIELTEKFVQLTNHIYNEPIVTVYNASSIPLLSTHADWSILINNFLVMCKVNPNWIMETTKSNPHLDAINVHLISHCVKDKVLYLISNYIEENGFDELKVYVTKNKT